MNPQKPGLWVFRLPKLPVKLNCTQRIDVDKDSVAISDLYEHVEKEESLEVQRPELAKNWNYARNGMLTPHMVAPKSNRKYWWICENGHEWQASPNSMKTGVCPYCNNKKVLV